MVAGEKQGYYQQRNRSQDAGLGANDAAGEPARASRRGTQHSSRPAPAQTSPHRRGGIGMRPSLMPFLGCRDGQRSESAGPAILTATLMVCPKKLNAGGRSPY